jgi:phosphohistidine phosphatase
MKQVILIRHVKSDWTNLVEDFDRPIRKDREKDAKIIVKEIAGKGAIPQYIITSPAKRTLQTTKIIASEWKLADDHIAIERTLYESSSKEILTTINNAKEKYNHIAIICHNPSITDFVNQFSNGRIDNVPTSGAVQISFDVKHWKDITGHGKLNWFLRPKEL